MKTEVLSTLIKIFKVILIFAILDVCLGSIAQTVFYNQKSGKFYRATYAIQESNDDLLIFGSSHAHRHYVPEVFENKLNKTSYNAGAEGQQLLFHHALQKMIFKRTTPEVIILNIDENFLYHSEVAYDRLSDLHPYYSDYKNELRPILSQNSAFTDIKLFFKAYQTNSTLVHVIKYKLKPQADYKGYRPLYNTITEQQMRDFKPELEEKEYTEIIDDVFVRALNDFIEATKNRNVTLVFVTSPNLIRRNLSNNASLNKIKAIAELKNVPFLDFLNAPDYLGKNHLFHDTTHLNDDGAHLFSASVADYLKYHLYNNNHKSLNDKTL